MCHGQNKTWYCIWRFKKCGSMRVRVIPLLLRILILARNGHAGSLSNVVWHAISTRCTDISSYCWHLLITSHTCLPSSLQFQYSWRICSDPNSFLARIFIGHNETISPFHQAFSRGSDPSARACIRWYIECVNFLGPSIGLGDLWSESI